MNRPALSFLFGTILIAMLAVVTWASLDRSVLAVDPRVLADRWFITTLVDAYCSFFVFFVWVAYRETSWPARGLWFIAIMSLGSLAIATYLLWRLSRLSSGGGASELLLRPVHSSLTTSKASP